MAATHTTGLWMKIENIINKKLIDLNISAGSKIEALDTLIELLYQTNRISDKKEFLKEILDREKIETTDLGFGIAIPHGRCSAVIKPSVVIGKLRTPVIWNGSDESQEVPVYGIFLMASSPEDKGVSHMEIIAKIATLLIADDFVAYFKDTQSEEGLLEKIKTLIGEG
jgi:fructose-specific phosphotransferase system IIA component